MGRNILGGILAATLMLCVCLSTLNFVLSVVLPDRQALASATGTTADTKKSEWEFATNWSLPPEEMLEFVAPCVFGIQTGDSRGPYWGRLGRSLGWEESRRGLMNLRQHTVYLGVIQLVFGAFAVVWALGRRSQKSGVRSQESRDGERGGKRGGERTSNTQHSTPNAQGTRRAERERTSNNLSAEAPKKRRRIQHPTSNVQPDRKADTLFWAGVFVAAMLLAMGRYFPLYRLFYMIPYAASLRAPVKFLHLVEISAAVLLAFGLQALWSDAADRAMRRVFGFGCAAAGVLFMFGPAVVSARASFLREKWATMGMAQHSEALLDLARSSLVHASLLFFVCGAVFLIAYYVSSPYARRIVPVVLLLILAVDLESVAKRYITVWDDYARFTPGEIIARLESDKAEYRVSLPARGGIYDLWRTHLFPRNWITLLDAEDAGSFSPADQSFYSTLGRNPIRLWQLTSTRNVLGPTASLASLAQSAAVQPVGFFNILQDGSVQWAQDGRGQQVWMRIRGTLPRAALYATAEYAEGTSWTNRLADPEWNPARSVIVSTPQTDLAEGSALCVPAKIVSYKPNRVELATQSSVGGILMLNDRYDPKWEVFVDNKAESLLRCNGVMRGVRVPAGDHKVVFLYRPQWPYFAANAAGTGTLFLWGIALLWIRRRTRTASR